MYNGLLPDLRSDAEKDKDWKADELFVMGSPSFRVVKENEWAKYQIRNQDGSGSCVAQSQAKHIEIAEQLKTHKSTQYSATPVYQKRVNRPQAGMGFPDAPKLQTTVNSCHESQCPSQLMSDSQMDNAILPPNYEDINDEAKPNAYITIPVDFFSVASYVETHGACIIWVNSDYSHWSVDFPTVGGKNGGVRHSVCVVDAVTFQGTKYLVIEDSWGTFGKFNGQRLLSKEFFDDAVYFAYALTQFTFESDATNFDPFTVPMQYNQKTPEIARLQKYLKSRGFFPKETQETGFYGSVTALAVLNWQIAKKVDNLITLNQLKGRFFGKKSLSVINNNL